MTSVADSSMRTHANMQTQENLGMPMGTCAGRLKFKNIPGLETYLKSGAK